MIIGSSFLSNLGVRESKWAYIKDIFKFTNTWLFVVKIVIRYCCREGSVRACFLVPEIRTVVSKDNRPFPVDTSSVKYPSCFFQTQWRIRFHSSHSWCKSLCSPFQCIHHCCLPPLFRNLNSASSPNTVTSHYPAFWMTVSGIWKTVWVSVLQKDPLQILPMRSITSHASKSLAFWLSFIFMSWIPPLILNILRWWFSNLFSMPKLVEACFDISFFYKYWSSTKAWTWQGVCVLNLKKIYYQKIWSTIATLEMYEDLAIAS